MPYPVTSDGQYFIVRGRLWRCTNPNLPPDERTRLTRDLMAARRQVGVALRAKDAAADQSYKAWNRRSTAANFLLELAPKIHESERGKVNRFVGGLILTDASSKMR